MIFQRRAAVALCDPLTRAQAKEAFMRDPWTFFRLPAAMRAAAAEDAVRIDESDVRPNRLTSS